jgi:hypothetical protein
MSSEKLRAGAVSLVHAMVHYKKTAGEIERWSDKSRTDAPIDLDGRLN